MCVFALKNLRHTQRKLGDLVKEKKKIPISSNEWKHLDLCSKSVITGRFKINMWKFQRWKFQRREETWEAIGNQPRVCSGIPVKCIFSVSLSGLYCSVLVAHPYLPSLHYIRCPF